jgi:hypothetical protein
MGRKLPTVRAVRDAVQSKIPPTHPLAGVSDGVEWRPQRDSTITPALALPQLFYVEGEVLKKVELFRYLGRILAQDDDDVRAVRSQIKKAWVIWARVGQVLQADNTPPKVSTKFYKAVVQSVLLYGSETWNLTTTALSRLEGFHIRAAYRMAKKHKPWKGPNHVWVYPATEDVLKECGMHPISHYIGVRRETIFCYMEDWQFTPCARRVSKEGDRRRGSGGGSRRCAWATKMQTELANRGTLVGSMDGIRSAHLSGGEGFTWNVGRTIGILTVTVLNPLFIFFARGTCLEGGKRGVQKCDSVDPISLVIKCLGGGGAKRRGKGWTELWETAPFPREQSKHKQNGF